MSMQKHLDDGCKKCLATVQTWSHVLTVAEREQSLTPPDDVVRVVRGFAPMQAVKSGVRLVFDSNLQPSAAGFRGSISARQLLYQTDDYYVDLHLEPRRESERACLVGQVMNRTGKDTLARGVSVRLKAGNLPLGETTANQYGEFQFEFDTATNLCISIVRDRDTEIVLPLSGAEVKPFSNKGLH